ncbi:MAG: hypothetical protein AYK18_14615 [Theionarchaea archaeon DG-70]|nr:MAG: hypothetical protein AYK18_14615 [Theionarchaea archaeon DG-70]
MEDTGSLQGLADCLEQNEYDVIHLSGHANIEDGTPYFCMEDEEGSLEKVTPSQLQEILDESLKRPRLVFLSWCRTGQHPAAAVSFAHYLVAEHSPTVVGWGLPVSDPGATLAATKLYRELSRGKSIVDAVFSARQVLYKSDFPDWSLLRLFSDGTPLDIPLVKKGQKRKLKARDIQHTYLKNSRVKILKKGFVGRRRQIQRGIRSLKEDEEKVGLLLHGTGGLGKSCLAGKFCERFKDHVLVIVKGELNAVTFLEALTYGLMRAEDEKGLAILQAKEEVPKKIMLLCSSSFRNNNYLILFDDFEENLEGFEGGTPVVSDEDAPILGMLLHDLPLACKSTQLIITSRYTFPFVIDGRNLVEERLECIGLTSFQGADERKKIADLIHINKYPDEEVRKELIKAGRGNPRLMEALNTLLEIQRGIDVEDLLLQVQDEQEEFVQDLVLREILTSQPQDFQKVMQYSAVFRLPVLREGIQLICKDVEGWQSFIDLGVQLSLMEEDKSRDVAYYWVTPLLREEIFEELDEKERTRCHKAAVVYYRKILSLVGEYLPVYAFELIDHALECGMDEVALEKGSELLSYLRNTLAYTEALSEGDHILSQIPEPIKDDKFSSFLFELGWIYLDVRDLEKAIMYYEQALEVDREIYEDKHSRVVRDLDGLGLAWKSLGDPKKAIEYYEQALEIGKEIYGEKHPSVARDLNNLLDKCYEKRVWDYDSEIS